MILSPDQVAAEAALLDQAERTATSIRQTTSVHPEATIDDAYRIQAAWLDLQLARGERLVGHKIGLTSRAMQAAMNIDTPDSGFLTASMVFEPDSTLDSARFCDPKLEVELAFVLATDLAGADLSIDDVLDATERVVPAIELIDARSWRRDPETGRTRTVIDTIADNAADAGIVCGPVSAGPRDLDLRRVGAIAERNGVVEETGLGAAVLGDPVIGVVWLANRLQGLGIPLTAGETVLAGSFTRPIDMRAGDHFEVDYGELGVITLDVD